MILVLWEGLPTTKPPLTGIGWFVHVIYPEHWRRCLGYQHHTPHHTILFPEHSSKESLSRDHRTAWSNHIQLQRPSFTNPEIRYIPLRKATIWDKIIHHLTLLYRSIQTRKSPACARWAWKELCLFWHRSGSALQWRREKRNIHPHIVVDRWLEPVVSTECSEATIYKNPDEPKHWLSTYWATSNATCQRFTADDDPSRRVQQLLSSIFFPILPLSIATRQFAKTSSKPTCRNTFIIIQKWIGCSLSRICSWFYSDLFPSFQAAPVALSRTCANSPDSAAIIIAWGFGSYQFP